MLVTNVPASKLSIEQALVLIHTRWQIELLFKLWKQDTLIDESNGTKPWRVLCEVYANLLAMVVQHWFVLFSCCTPVKGHLIQWAKNPTSCGNGGMLNVSLRTRKRAKDQSMTPREGSRRYHQINGFPRAISTR
jgi:hypothetical protein